MNIERPTSNGENASLRRLKKISRRAAEFAERKLMVLWALPKTQQTDLSSLSLLSSFENNPPRLCVLERSGREKKMNRVSMTTAEQSTPTKTLTYVLITPARNEEAYIEENNQSVVSQTVKPLRWVVVSDGSTDRTDEIVSKYIAENPWIELVRTPERTERHFAGKVHAFNTGYARLKDLDYDIIGNLDADISFEPDYFAFLLGKLTSIRNSGSVGRPSGKGRTSTISALPPPITSPVPASCSDANASKALVGISR